MFQNVELIPLIIYFWFYLVFACIVVARVAILGACIRFYVFIIRVYVLDIGFCGIRVFINIILTFNSRKTVPPLPCRE